MGGAQPCICPPGMPYPCRPPRSPWRASCRPCRSPWISSLKSGRSSHASSACLPKWSGSPHAGTPSQYLPSVPANLAMPSCLHMDRLPMGRQDTSQYVSLVMWVWAHVVVSMVGLTQGQASLSLREMVLHSILVAHTCLGVREEGGHLFCGGGGHRRPVSQWATPPRCQWGMCLGHKACPWASSPVSEP